MRVMVAHTGTVQSNCAAALRLYAPGAEYVDTSASDQAYGEAIAARWNIGGDLVTVEHDNEITAEVLPSFAACPEPWCTYAYEIFAPPWTMICETALGCTKFSAEFQAKFDFTERVLNGVCVQCHVVHQHHWGDLDARIATQVATYEQLSPHVHGQVNHYHPYLATVPGDKGPRRPAVDFEGEFHRVGG